MKSTKNIAIAISGHAAVGSTAFLALNKAWYSNYSKTSFHFFNDMGEWMQMDKAGHVWTSYQLARTSTSIWKWSGMNTTKSILAGSISAFAFQSIIEMQDAYSVKWGYSLTDMMANILGISTFALQELQWNEQRIQVKFQYSPYKYPDEFLERKKQLFGSNLTEQILKDYNSQIYWMSINVHAFFPNSHIPKWFNLAIGYNARIMLGGRENIWTNIKGQTIDASDQKRFRRYFLSMDIDLTKIQTKNKFLHNVLCTFNCVKLPFPAFELNSLGKIQFHLIQ
ncbi:MAG: DUF2279 domain-containing protein [Chitinophagaceae bacterium]